MVRPPENLPSEAPAKTRRWGLAARAGLTALALGGCSGHSAADHHLPEAPPVHVEPVRAETHRPTARTTGTLEPSRSAVLSARSAGVVQSVEARVGDRVAAEQAILRIDPTDHETQAELASAQLAQARLALRQASRARARMAELTEAGAAPRAGLEEAASAHGTARAVLRSARARRRTASRELEETVLRAPFAGSLVDVVAEVGEMVGPGTPVAMLVVEDPLEARLLVDPRVAIDLDVGSEARVVAFARPEETLVGRVAAVGRAVDAASRRLPVFIEVPDPEDRLRPGLLARFEVALGRPRSILTVRADAPFERFGTTFVYVVRDGRAERREVELGARIVDRREVTRGLEEGESVVVAGRSRVVDGLEVKVVVYEGAEVRK